jgi:hypothetical protein
MTTEKQYINKFRQNKITLASKDSYKGASEKTGVAGHGSLSYNVQWKMPKGFKK